MLTVLSTGFQDWMDEQDMNHELTRMVANGNS
jgi:hypothetical protein